MSHKIVWPIHKDSEGFCVMNARDTFKYHISKLITLEISKVQLVFHSFYLTDDENCNTKEYFLSLPRYLNFYLYDNQSQKEVFSALVKKKLLSSQSPKSVTFLTDSLKS